jgi:hypothetical protein
MSEAVLSSDILEVEDAIEANELYQRNGWTDGLPIVPPTEARVHQFVEAMALQPQDVIGTEPVRRRKITAEKVAIAAVMAGCLPEYMPVVRAVVQSMCEPQFGLHGSTASTGGAAPLVIVNGPVRKQIGMNATHNALGNASRANASIGRTVRLILLNVLGGFPGQLDRSTFGYPGKFTFCVAEDEEDSRWLSLAHERGVAEGQSAATVVSVVSPHQLMNEWTHEPKELLETYASVVRSNMLEYSIWAGNYVMFVGKQHRDVFNAAGWTKQDIREHMFERCRVLRGQWRDVGKASIAALKDEGKEYLALRSPDDLLIVAAGGPAGGFGAIAPPWIGSRSLAVTTPLAK